MNFLKKLKYKYLKVPELNITAVKIANPWVCIIEFKQLTDERRSYYLVLHGDYKLLRKKAIDNNDNGRITPSEYEDLALKVVIRNHIFEWKQKF